MSEHRVLVVEHQASCPAALVGDWLADLEVRLEVVRPYLGESVPGHLHADGLLVLGGSMGANDDDRAPWLPATRDLIASAADAAHPVLGICLGHQLAAVALGGRVGRNPHGQTVGARDVVREADPGDDPVGSALSPSSAVPQWNDDIVLDLPRGAAPIAYNDRGDLLMARLSATVWGIQGHPEADAAIVARWAEADLAEGGLTGAAPAEVPRLLDEIDERGEEMRGAWRPVVTAFAALL